MGKINQSHLDIPSIWKMFLCVMSYAFLALARDFFFYMAEYEPYVFFIHVVVRRSKGYICFEHDEVTSMNCPLLL